MSSAAVDAQNPFAGLQSFGEADRELFRGREAEAQDLFRLVRREVLTVLFGRSGLGKTSLLHAGLFPLLRDASCLPLPIRLDFTPGGSLEGRLKAQIGEAVRREKIDAAPPGDGETLWEYFHRARWWSTANRLLTPVLVFDQIEEIFTLGRGDSRVAPLLTELADLIENQLPRTVRDRLAETGEELPFAYDRQKARVIFSLREDFLAQLEDLRPRIPSITRSRFRLVQMTGAQARRAVVEPAGELVSEAVAGEILRFVAGHGQEAGPEEAVELDRLEIEPALLSLFCRELNERRIAQGLAAITGDVVRGARGQILTDFYERSVAGVPAAVRSFVEDRLLTASGFRHSEPLEEAVHLSGVTEEELRLLVDRRLLRLEPRLGHLHVELIHDLLTRVVRESRDRRHARERWRRQLRRLSAAAAVLTVLLAGSGWIALRQMELEHAAETQRARAEEVLSFVLFDLNEKLGPVGRLDLMKGVQETALRYFDSLPEQGESAASARQRAAVCKNLGKVYVQQGQLDRAQQLFRRGIAIAERFARRGDAAPEMQEILGLLHLNLGQTRKSLGDSRDAFAEIWTGCRILRPLAAGRPGNAEWQEDVSICHSDLAGLLGDAGKLEPAFEQQTASLAILERLATRDPGNPRWQRSLASGLIDLGDLFVTKGEPEHAMQAFSRASALYTRLAQDDPGDTDLQTSLSVVVDRLASNYERQGDLRRALAAFLESLRIDKQLAERDPSSVLWQENLAITYNNIGRLSALLHNFAGARAAYEENLAILQRLAAASPAQTGPQESLASSNQTFGDLLEKQGAHREALRVYLSSRQVYQMLVARDPRNPDWRNGLSWSHVGTGNVYAALGQPEQARLDWSRAVEVLAPAAATSQQPNLLDTYARALLLLGRKEEARPFVEKLLAKGWDAPGFLALVRKNALGRDRGRP